MGESQIKVGDVVAWADVPPDTLVAISKRRLYYRGALYGRTVNLSPALLGGRQYEWTTWKPKSYKCTIVAIGYAEKPANERGEAIAKWLA